MATTNYNLPTITGASPVAIVDDYNGLANATDAAIAGAISTEKTRAMAAETELANGVSNALSTANNASVSATAANTAAEKASAAATAEAARATAAENALTADIAAINALFPVASDNIADGAVTAPKLAASAISAVLQSLEIKRFDINDSSADNEGMSAASNVKELRGWYVPNLGILCIELFKITDNGNANTVLPSYVPAITVDALNLELAMTIGYSSSNDFIGTHFLQMLSGSNTIHVSGNGGSSSQTQQIFAPVILYLAPYASGAFSNASIASDFANDSGVVGSV